MKAITLTQPWATLVTIGAKRIETRSWATAYRGPLAIHAAKGLGPVGGKKGLRELCMLRPFCEVLPNAGEGLPLGVIVATCELIACVQVTAKGQTFLLTRGETFKQWFIPPLTDHEYAFGDYTLGRYAWLLNNVQSLSEPVPARGALGLWEWQP